MRYATLFIVILATAALAVDAPSINPHGFKTVAAKSAWIRYNSRAKLLKERYERDLQAARTDLMRDLEAAKLAATKAGNLEEAVRIKGVVEGNTANQSIAGNLAGTWVRFAFVGDRVVDVLHARFGTDGRLVVLDGNTAFDRYRVVDDVVIFNDDHKMAFRASSATSLHATIDGKRHVFIKVGEPN